WAREASRNRYRGRRGMKTLKRFNRDSGQRGAEIASGYRNDNGSVAAEFALMAPIIFLIAAGIADFGMLATKSAGLAATARIGAEYARTYPDDTSVIQHAMQSAMGFAPALIFPASFPRSCECDDETPISCSASCATVGRRGPNRVFIRIVANQPF